MTHFFFFFFSCQLGPFSYLQTTISCADGQFWQSHDFFSVLLPASLKFSFPSVFVLVEKRPCWCVKRYVLSCFEIGLARERTPPGYIDLGPWNPPLPPGGQHLGGFAVVYIPPCVTPCANILKLFPERERDRRGVTRSFVGPALVGARLPFFFFWYYSSA